MRHSPASVWLYCLLDQSGLDALAAADWLALSTTAEVPVAAATAHLPAPAGVGQHYVVRVGVEAAFEEELQLGGTGQWASRQLTAPELAALNVALTRPAEVVAVV